jgi:hypothetical protein
MKVELVSYEHSSNGLSLHVQPETQVEEKLLMAIWKHGVLATDYPNNDVSIVGNSTYMIKWEL